MVKKCTMAPSNGPIHGKMDDGNGLTLGKNGEKKKAVWYRTAVYSSSQSLSFSFLILLSIACVDFFTPQGLTVFSSNIEDGLYKILYFSI